MIPFLKEHPEWSDHATLETAFEWKWYYAFQQVGDQVAAPLVNQYRSARLARDREAAMIAFLSPTSFVERSFEKLAGTDAASMIAYEDAVRDFHKQLRTFHYPLLFPDEPFDQDLLEGLPVFTPKS